MESTSVNYPISDAGKTTKIYMRKLRIVLLILILVSIGLTVFLRHQFGGGLYYNDLTGSPVLPNSSLEVVATYPEPFGNLAVAPSGRLFFSIHPESRPRHHKVLEWVNGQAVPYPNEEAQQTLFQTVLGMVIDQQGRLWTLDHGFHGTGKVRLLAFDLSSDEIVHDFTFSSEIAPIGSLFNDLQVSPDGQTLYISDVSFFRKQPAIVVYDIARKQAFRKLECHPSVSTQDWIIHTRNQDMVFLGGILALKPGVDGLALDPNGAYLYYGAMTHEYLFRVPTHLLQAPGTDIEKLSASVEQVGAKPLSDGLSMDMDGNVYITDVEHSAIHRMTPDGTLKTLIKDEARIRWADGLSFGPDSMLYFTDSAIPDQILKSRQHIAQRGPYYLYRFKNDRPGIPGR